MKNRLLTLAGALALLAVLGKFYAVPLMAQVRAALVQDRDSKARNFYQAISTCQGTSGTCQIFFAAVPAGKRLIVEHVSVLLPMPAAGTISGLELRGGSTFQFLPISANPGNYSTQFSYVANEAVLAGYDTGQAPNVNAYSTSAAAYSGEAMVSGYTIDLP